MLPRRLLTASDNTRNNHNVGFLMLAVLGSLARQLIADTPYNSPDRDLSPMSLILTAYGNARCPILNLHTLLRA
jgi:hypothetical protein